MLVRVCVEKRFTEKIGHCQTTEIAPDNAARHAAKVHHSKAGGLPRMCVCVYESERETHRQGLHACV